MLVKDWMSKNVVTIDPEDSMHEAVELMKKHKIRFLPVVKNGILKGVVTDRDIKRSSASDATSLEVHEMFYILSKIQVDDIMSRDPVSIPDDYTVEEAAEILLKHKFSGLPVLNRSGGISGVITLTDLLKVLVTLTGIGQKGIQFAVLVKDIPGSIWIIADLIRSYGGRIVSVLTGYEGAPKGCRKVYIRSYDIERRKIDELAAKIDNSSEKLLYMVDHRHNIRDIRD